MDDQAQAAVDTAPVEVTEYASHQLTIDHLSLNSEGTSSKVVLSTQSAYDSLMAQLNYYGQTALLSFPITLKALAAVQDEDAIIVYSPTDRQTNVIVDAGLFATIVDAPEFGKGSILEAHASLTVLAVDMIRDAKEQAPNGNHQILVYKPA